MANLRTNNLSGEQGQNAYRGSVFFDGVDNSNLAITSNSDFTFGTGVFTAECWIRVGAYPPSNVYGIFDTGTGVNSTRFSMVMYPTGKIYIDNNSNLIISDTILSTDSWHHLAFVREGTGSNESKLYINGVLDKSATISADFTNDDILIGKTIDNYEFKGYISNARITKGEAVYTANFTPPTSELTADANTVLLCCQDSNDPTQEETGKTITASGSLATAGYLETQPKVIPPYGVDAGNVFGGTIQQSSQGYMYFPTGRTEERGRGRAVFGGGANPGISSLIEYVHVPTDGNAIKFGDLSAQRNSIMAVSSQTRGIWGGGNPGTVTNTMEFVTLATTSDTTDFGDLTVARMHGGGVQNSTRGVFMTGYTPSNVNTIDFITMASTGDATDFGDVIDDGWPCGGGRSSSTRGVLMGHGDGTNRIQFITIMTTGNSQDFGDLNTNSYGVGAGELSDGLRGIAMGGSGNPSDHTNVIDFITIATTGNATEFGDLTVSRRGGGVGCTLIKGICAGGRNPSDVNIIDSVIIQTTGNATEFGELSEARAFQPAGCSDSHGGLT
jgi:hypothetical protein